MNNHFKRITAIAASFVMMGTVAMGASASYNQTNINPYQRIYYSGSNTTNNNYTAYTSGTNLTSSKRYMAVKVKIYNKSKKKIDGKISKGITAVNVYRQCYACANTSNIGYIEHESVIRKTSSSGSVIVDKFNRIITSL